MKQLFFLFFFLCITVTYGQRDYHYYKATNILIGYNKSFGASGSKDIHIIEAGLNKSVYGGMHGGGMSYGIGSEFLVNANDFTMAPKINLTMVYQFITFGTELITYTNFNNYSLRLVPFIGVGGEKFKVTINPQIILTNKNFQPVNKTSINFSVNFSLSRKRKKS